MDTTLADHVASQKKLDAGLYLGRLTWYQVKDMKVSHSQVVTGLNQHDLTTTLPPYPKDADVFRRVTTAAQVKRVPLGTEGKFENYLIREVAGSGEETVTRRIVVEIVDRKGKRLAYSQILDLEFDRKNSTIKVKEVNEPHDPVHWQRQRDYANVIVDEVRREFIGWRGMLNSYVIREFTRHLLLSWHATPVRDGVYFLPEAHAGEVDKLDAFLNGLAGGAQFHSMPLVDDLKQREMIRRAFQSESVDAVDALMGEIAEMKKAGKTITNDRYAKILTEYQAIMARTKDYEGMLEVEMDEVHARLGLFSKSVLGLQKLLKTEEVS